MSLKAELDKLKGQFADAAQKVYDEWEQDEEGYDEECGSGGICDLISREISDVIVSNLSDVELEDGGQDGDDHAYIIARRGDEMIGVDIDPRVYETGGGYSWKKRKGITIHGRDVDVFKANPKKIKNRNSGSKAEAEELSKKWHGRDVESEQQVDEIVTFDEDLAELADLEEIGIMAADLKHEFNIYFKHDRPKLTSTADGQLEIVGGDQELENLNGGKRHKPLGWLVRLVYETDKHHLEDTTGYPESYEHYFAEEYYKDYVSYDDYDTPDEWWEVVKANGILKLAIKEELIPMLVYDTVDHKLTIVGGVYTVEDVGIKN